MLVWSGCLPNGSRRVFEFARPRSRVIEHRWLRVPGPAGAPSPGISYSALDLGRVRDRAMALAVVSRILEASCAGWQGGFSAVACSLDPSLRPLEPRLPGF